MSEFNFSKDALRKLTEGKVAQHTRKQADELLGHMRDEAFDMQKAGKRGIIKAKISEIVQSQELSPGITAIGMPVGQKDSRKANRTSSFAEYLAKKAAERDARGDSWIAKSFKKTKFKRRG